MKSIIIFLVLIASNCFASDQLGNIEFKTSGSAEAQKEFLHGVLLLHSFEYPSARNAFIKAEQTDPNFAMAYWGEAMTYNHPIWNERDRDNAIAALNKLAPTPEQRLRKAPTQKEKDFLNAVEILFEDGEKKERDLAYAEAMEQMHRKYPDDLEAASFYALALLGSSENSRDIPTYMKAAAIAEEVFAKNPQHPGAVHYLIHSYDDPVHAPLGLRAARVYAKIAPSAVHALHMPSHIFLALGMWDDVESSNDASWKASKFGSYHAAHWLEYSYLQQGRFREARELLNKIEQQLKSNPDNQDLKWYLPAMRSVYVIESRTPFSELAASPEVPYGDSFAYAVADIFAAGLSAIHEKKIDNAIKYHSDIQKAMGSENNSQSKNAECKAHAANMSPAENIAVQIMEKELQAAILNAQGKKEDAFKLLKDATVLEDSMTFEFGPPLPVKPSHEMFAEFLLEAGKYKEAQDQFNKALARAPRRSQSLAGLAKAAGQSGDSQVAKEAQTELQNIRRKADAP
jgi:tetratricopeptide (TPR) repeat protein